MIVRALAADHSWEGFSRKPGASPGVVHWARVSARGVAHARCGVVWTGATPASPKTQPRCRKCFPPL